MIRLIIVILVVVVVAFWLFRPASEQQRHGTRTSEAPSWLKAGGLLGVLILISRLFCVPLASLLYSMPFFISTFRRAAEAGSHGQSQGSGMSRKEAELILGVKEGSSKDDILNAHRRLIAKNHPDVGGSDWLASKINEARDVLLRK